MSFPIADWQFWCVTAGAATALWAVVRPFLARPRRTTGPCASCQMAAGGRCGPQAVATLQQLEKVPGERRPL